MRGGKRVLVLALLALVAASVGRLALGSRTGAEPAESVATTPTETGSEAKAKTVVYYFHGTGRCHTCRTIEAYAAEALKAAFATEIESGRIAWQPTNVDEPANRHFVGDYQLFTRSLVLVDGSDPKRFKDLDKVWQLVRDKAAFLEYVQDEVRAFGKS